MLDDQLAPTTMLLFRYFGSHGFESLCSGRLKVSRVSTFNDPFDCMFRMSGDMTADKATAYIESWMRSPEIMKQIQLKYPEVRNMDALRHFRSMMAMLLVDNFDSFKNELLDDHYTLIDPHFRAVCFSESTEDPLDEILLWSHYAAKHRGIRIGFEFPHGDALPFQIVPVKYRSNRVKIDAVKLLHRIDIQDAFVETLRTKSKAWSYEKEHRLVAPIGHSKSCVFSATQDGQTLEFILFQKNWVKRVDFGARCAEAEIKKITVLLKKEYPQAERYRSRYHQSKYAFVYQRC
jgi:Protein of unknown function (DUF2971)